MNIRAPGLNKLCVHLAEPDQVFLTHHVGKVATGVESLNETLTLHGVSVDKLVTKGGPELVLSPTSIFGEAINRGCLLELFNGLLECLHPGLKHLLVVASLGLVRRKFSFQLSILGLDSIYILELVVRVVGGVIVNWWGGGKGDRLVGEPVGGRRTDELLWRYWRWASWFLLFLLRSIFDASPEADTKGHCSSQICLGRPCFFLNKQVSPTMSSWHDGDWMCVRPRCGGINFASRTKCRDCGLAKPTEFQPLNGRSKPSLQRRIGDWDCTCGFVNFGSRVACHSCGKSRTSEEETSTSNECVVCMDAPRDVLLATCRHLSMCTTCVQSVRECPICRATFDETDIIPVFIS